MAFTIMIDPGRRVYVRRISVVGNTKTRDEVIRRELRQLEGSFYDGQKLQESRKRVERLGYFEPGVELETEPVTGVTDQVDVTLKVKEKPTGAVLFGLGFSSADKLIVQGSISQANIFGSGKAISAERQHEQGQPQPRPHVHQSVFHGRRRQRRIQHLRSQIRRAGARDRQLHHRNPRRRRGIRLSDHRPRPDQLRAGDRADQDRPSSTVRPTRFVTFVEQNGNDPVGLPLSLGWVRDRRDSALLPTSGSIQRCLERSPCRGSTSSITRSPTTRAGTTRSPAT